MRRILKGRIKGTNEVVELYPVSRDTCGLVSFVEVSEESSQHKVFYPREMIVFEDDERDDYTFARIQFAADIVKMIYESEKLYSSAIDTAIAQSNSVDNVVINTAVTLADMLILKLRQNEKFKAIADGATK